MSGMPLPEVAGNCKTPNLLPPDSPVAIASCVPGATASPLTPKVKPANSGRDTDFPGAVHVPGEPGVEVFCVRSAMYTELLDSFAAKAIPVVQSAAAESSSSPINLA